MSERHEHARAVLADLVERKETEANQVADELVRALTRRDPDHDISAKIRIVGKLEASLAAHRRALARVDVVAHEDERADAAYRKQAAARSKADEAALQAARERKRAEEIRDLQRDANRRAMDVLATLDRVDTPNAMLIAALQIVAADEHTHDLYRDKANEALKLHTRKAS